MLLHHVPSWVLAFAFAHVQCSVLYVLPGIDMLNHSTDPSRRNTSLLRVVVKGGSSSGADEKSGKHSKQQQGVLKAKGGKKAAAAAGSTSGEFDGSCSGPMFVMRAGEQFLALLVAQA